MFADAPVRDMIKIFTPLFLLFHLVRSGCRGIYEIYTFPLEEQLFTVSLRDYYDYSYRSVGGFLQPQFSGARFEYNKNLLPLLDVKDQFDEQGFCHFDKYSNSIYAADPATLSKPMLNRAGMFYVSVTHQSTHNRHRKCAGNLKKLSQGFIFLKSVKMKF